MHSYRFYSCYRGGFSCIQPLTRVELQEVEPVLLKVHSHSNAISQHCWFPLLINTTIITISKFIVAVLKGSEVEVGTLDMNPTQEYHFWAQNLASFELEFGKILLSFKTLQRMTTKILWSINSSAIFFPSSYKNWQLCMIGETNLLEMSRT